MKFKKTVSVSLAAVMSLSLAACGSSSAAASTAASGSTDSTAIAYKDIEVGTTGTDITANLKFLTNRTDMETSDYAGKNWSQYIEDFNKLYPNITINVEGITDYSSDSLLRLQGGDWGDIMMIPDVSKADLSTYFVSYGTSEEVATVCNYANNQIYDGQVYGIPITAAARGIVYNKKVFSDAGITTLPKTPEEFIEDLQMIKEKEPDVIPLYTNYAEGWTLSAWDDYIGVTATGDSLYTNQELLHTKDPFTDPGDGTHSYNVYKILYDAVSNGLTEDDYTTTDWNSSKGMLNNGQIGTMVLGSWAVTQIKQAGDNADDVGYMPFPITVNGKQYATAAPDYCFGINNQDDAETIEAAQIFVKWMTEQSGFTANEGGLPLTPGDTSMPDLYKPFQDNNVEFIADEPSVKGEETLLNDLNDASELNVEQGGKEKVAAIVEAASTGSQTFDDIMGEWNTKWDDALTSTGTEVK